MKLATEILIFGGFGAVMASADVTVSTWQFWAGLACLVAAQLHVRVYG